MTTPIPETFRQAAVWLAENGWTYTPDRHAGRVEHRWHHDTLSVAVLEYRPDQMRLQLRAHGAGVLGGGLSDLTGRQAVDVLCAVGILPPGLSSLSDKGWSAACIAVAARMDRAAERFLADDEWNANEADLWRAAADVARRMAGTSEVPRG